MQPSSDRSGTAAPGNAAMRRWGPVAAIVVVLAVVAGVVVLGGDDDDDDDGTAIGQPAGEDDTGSGDTTTTLPSGEPPEGAVSWSTAEAQGITDELTWPESCDLETGLVQVPLSLKPECYADAEGNGGATARGVTEDSVKVVVYLPPDNDIVLTLAMAAINADDTNAQVRETFEQLNELFGYISQTYGRSVDLEFLIGSGNIADEVAARADAVRAIEEMEAFAVWGGPLLSNAWTEEIQARGGICIDCPGLTEPDPNVYSAVPSAEQTRIVTVEYVSKKLAGRPAVHAGDEGMHDQERVFGQVYLDTGTQDVRDSIVDMNERWDEAGVEIAEQIGYELDPGRFAEQAGNIVARFQDAGVTTVLFAGDPIAPVTMTQAFTQQGYFPEWVLTGSTLVDTSAFGRTFDQDQWRNAFGLTALTTPVVDGLADPERLYEWWTGGPPPAPAMIKIRYPQPTIFYLGLQAAGPNLTPETFRDGLFSLEPQDSALTRQIVTYGYHGIWEEMVDFNGVDDFAEMWWDPDLEGPNEVNSIGTGMVRYVDGGRRYLPGEWPEDLRVFDPDAAIAIYDELPPGEEPGDAPLPPHRR